MISALICHLKSFTVKNPLFTHYNSPMSEHQIAPPVWVDTPRELEKTVQALTRAPYLSVDTESNSLYVYQEQVCLIQISTGDTDYLIDPLALHDLSPLADFFADPAQEKIFHASEYDIICLKRDFNFQFANLFDTMIAARILGEEAIGLAALLQTKLGILMDKKYQRANWGIRPLSELMLDYARLDSHYLYQLRNILEPQLKEAGLWELALEDFHLACMVEAHPVPANQQNCWKVAGGQEIDPREAAILQELCSFREKQARKQNVPPFKVLSNEVLYKLSKTRPTTLAQLPEIRGLTHRLIDRYGASLLEAIQRGEAAEPVIRKNRNRPDEHFLKRLDILHEWRKLKGKELKVESDVILPREYIETIAAENPESTYKLNTIMGAIPWRFQHFGTEIIRVLNQQENK